VSRRSVQMKKETMRGGAGRDGRLDGNIYITCTREGTAYGAVGFGRRGGERERNYAMGTFADRSRRRPVYIFKLNYTRYQTR